MSISEWVQQISAWEYHVERISKSSLPQAKKELTFEAISMIQQKNFGFDDDWLSCAAKGRHPMINWLIGYTPEFTSELLLDFAKKLEALNNVKGFNTLLGRIRETREYYGAIGEFELASRVVMNGYEIELAPKVGGRRADIKVEMRPDDVYFEVKSLRESKAESKSREIQQWGYSLAENLGIYGKVHMELSKGQEEMLGTKIRAAVQDVKRSGVPKEVIEDRIMTVLLTPTGYDPAEPYLQKWLIDKKLPAIGFLGPDFGSIENNSHRLKRVFGENRNQLPQNYPGIKIIYAPVMYMMGLNNFPPEILCPFEKELNEQQNLLAGGLVYSYYLLEKPATQDEVVREQNYVLLKQIFFNQIHENTLLVKNRCAKFKIPVEPEEFFKKHS